MCPARRHIDSTLVRTAKPTLFDHRNAPKVTVKRKPPAQRGPAVPAKKIRLNDSLADPPSAPAPPQKRGRRESEVNVTAMRSEIWRLRRQVQYLKRSVTVAMGDQQKASAGFQRVLKERPALEDFKPAQRPFIGLQMRAVGKSRVREYSDAEKQDALATFHRSSSAYRHLSTIHAMPAVSTLRKLLSGCMKDTGPCPILLNAIKCKLSEATTDRLCTIGFDAMSLTPALRYFEHCDRVVGFEDVGTPGRSTKVANQGLVCVLRGIGGKWKLPIGYFL